MFTFSSLERMNQLVAKANKPIAKLGLTPISVIDWVPRKVKVTTEAGGEYVYVVYDAEISIPTELVQIAGTRVIARIERIGGLNMVTRIGGKTEHNLDQYRDAPIACQHCNLKRSRKGSWVCCTSDGSVIQVGDTCVDLYFGINVEQILSALYRVHSILDSDEYFGSGRTHEPIAHFINLCVWAAATQGFVTRKQADLSGGSSTSEESLWLASPVSSNNHNARLEHREKNEQATEWLTENDMLNAYEKVVDYWIEHETPAEFEHNCRVAVLSGTLRHQGLVAYAAKMWFDSVTEQAAAPESLSQYVGEIGKREVFNLTVKSLFSYDTQYDITTMIIFSDQQGNCLVWKASGNPGLTVGESYSVKSTVKNHTEYKGTKQTLLTRCAIG